MASARGLYRLQLAFAAFGVAAVALALGVALTRVNFRLPSLAAIGEACRGMGITDVSSRSLAVLGLSSLALAAIALALRSIYEQLRSQRRFRATLGELDAAEVAGSKIMVTASPRPQAFCAGLLRPCMYVSRGAIDLLDAEELLRRLTNRYAVLAELAADEAAVRQSGDRRALAAALLAFEEAPSAAVVGIAPERLDHLLGTRPRWELPLALMLGTAVTLAGLLAFVTRTAEVTGRASVDMPQLLAQACMVAMAAAPVLAGAAALLGAKRALLARRRC